MKYLLLILSLVIFNTASFDLYSQTDGGNIALQEEEMPESLGEDPFKDVPDEIPESEKYLRESYEDTFDMPFEDVWTAIKDFLTESNCMILKDSYTQTEEGIYRGSLHSDMCVLAQGDTTLPVIKRYSLMVPFIRGGVWINGRMQYKFIVREQEDGTVTVKLVGEMSGFEEHVTKSVHFWESNGYLETLAMQNIRKRLGMDPLAF